MTDSQELEVHHWRSGDTVVLRYIRRSDGQPGTAWPFGVVEDRDELVALFLPKGTHFRRWESDPKRNFPGSVARGRLVEGSAHSDILRLMFPGRLHSVWLFWDVRGRARRFLGYYVNMEEPFRRTPIGFDTNDHALDIVVTPELTWRWKDEAQFSELVELGRYSREFADVVRSEATQVIAAIEARSSPFCDGWEAWTPDPSWKIPELPVDWNTVPASLWERRRWAYGQPHT